MPKILLLLVALAFALGLGLVLWPEQETATQESKANVTGFLSEETGTNGFKKATAIQPIDFTADMGLHPGFQTEWWYFTGNLESATGRNFGYQFTLFKRALSPEPSDNPASFATNRVFFAHLALTDSQADRFYSFERFMRGLDALAGVQTKPFAIWLEDWRVKQTGDSFQLHTAEEGIAIELELTPQKPPIMQGEKGLSRKSSKSGNASYYFSITRLFTQGRIRTPEGEFEVSGLSWFDREWSTSALSPDQEGWDWFSMQFQDGRDLMLYRLRLKKGGQDPFSSGTLVLKDGTKIHLSSADFKVTPQDYWQSPRTKIRYPSVFRIEVPKHGIDLITEPAILDQEHRGSLVYWEGAIHLRSDKVMGRGYAELTGYDVPQ